MKTMIVLLFLLFVASIPVVSAFSASETIANGTVSGFNGILRSITDQILEMNGLSSTNVTTAMSNAMVSPNDFLSNQLIQKEKDVTAFWFIIFYIIFLLVGGIKLFQESAIKEGMGLDGNSWRNTYITIAVVAQLIWAFYLIGFQWIFSLEYVLSKSVMLELTDVLPLRGENAVAYLLLGVIMVINLIFFKIRYMVIGLVAGWFLFIVIAYFIPITKIYGKLLINYGLLMLFSRFVVVLIFIGGYGIIIDVPLSIPLTIHLKSIQFLLILCLAVLFELACVLYPFLYIRSNIPISIISRRK